MNEKRLVELTSPEKPFLGTVEQEKLKKKMVSLVLAGVPIREATEREFISMKKFVEMRRHDESFDAAILAAQEEVRKMMIPEVESNIWDQGKEPTPAGARIGIRLMEEFAGWGNKKKAVVDDREKADANEEALADWYDDPVIFDADFREVEDNDE